MQNPTALGVTVLRGNEDSPSSRPSSSDSAPQPQKRGTEQKDACFEGGKRAATRWSEPTTADSSSSQPAVTTASLLRITTSPCLRERPRLALATNPRFCEFRRTTT